MNKRGMTRLTTKPSTTLTVPTTKTKPVPDVYVVHVIPEQRKEVFTDHKSAFKAWKAVSGRPLGSAALWHGPKWVRVTATPQYPEKLSQPYIKEQV
jgi:hypothetical protein